MAPNRQDGSHQSPQEAEGMETSGGERGGDWLPSSGRHAVVGEVGAPPHASPPYLLASLGAQAACTCPVRLWLPGVVGGWKPSMRHLLGAGQLPPAELFVRLLVHHQQPSLPFHSLDPLHHLGRAGWGEQVSSRHSGQHMDSGATQGWPRLVGRQLAYQGWVAGPRGPPAPPPTPGAPAAPSLFTQHS